MSTKHDYRTNVEINPWSWNQPMGFSQAVLVAGAEQTLHTSGQCAIDADGNPVGIGDVAAQAAQVMDNLEAVLAAAGMGLADVVRYDIYCTNLPHYFEAGHERVVKRFAEAGVLPAGGICTQVASLAMPFLELEITAVACR